MFYDQIWGFVKSETKPWHLLVEIKQMVTSGKAQFVCVNLQIDDFTPKSDWLTQSSVKSLCVWASGSSVERYFS